MPLRKMLTSKERKKLKQKQEERREAQRKKYTAFAQTNRCRFCRESVKEVDYKNVAVLLKLITGQGKLYSRKRSGNCAFHQRSTTRAVKRARFLALLPYIVQ